MPPASSSFVTFDGSSRRIPQTPHPPATAIATAWRVHRRLRAQTAPAASAGHGRHGAAAIPETPVGPLQCNSLRSAALASALLLARPYPVFLCPLISRRVRVVSPYLLHANCQCMADVFFDHLDRDTAVTGDFRVSHAPHPAEQEHVTALGRQFFDRGEQQF